MECQQCFYACLTHTSFGSDFMRLAYYTETYFPNMDGVVKSIVDSRTQLEAVGDEIYIFTCGTKELIQANKDPRVFYYDSIPFSPYPSYRFAINPYPSAAIVDSKKVELIHSHGMGTMGIAAERIARKRKLPFVGSFHTLIQYATHYISQRRDIQDFAREVAWKYLRWYYNKCDITISPSQTICDLLSANGFKDVQVVPNGIHFERFHSAQPDREAFGLREDEQVFLFVGRMVVEKNLEVLIRASKSISKELPDAKFVIAGTGPAESYYKQLAVDVGASDKFKFLGFVSDQKIASLYKSADVFVFPSKFETQGLSGLEAMASGLPVCGADYLALKEIIRDGHNGYRFSPDSPDECAEAAVRTFNERAKLSPNAVESARAYSFEKTSMKLREVYLSLLEGRK